MGSDAERLEQAVAQSNEQSLHMRGPDTREALGLKTLREQVSPTRVP